MPTWTAKTTDGVTVVKIDEIAAKDEVWVLLRSDAHHDSPFCNRKLERQHLELAKLRNAIICDGGDTLDGMQGRFDKRKSNEEIRPEDVTDAYYDSIVEHAAEDYAPYARQWACFGKGNHETSIIKHAGTDVISNLVFRLNTSSGSNIAVGGYRGYVVFQFRFNKTKLQTYRMKWHHGSGGAAPVTRGVLHTNRQAVWLPDADIIWNGHNHQNYVLPIPRERLSRSNKVLHDVLWFVRTPGYKDERDRTEGFAAEMMTGPTPMGCVWLNFRLHNDRMKMTVSSDIE